MNSQADSHPVYQQLHQQLRKSLAVDFRAGDKFLTEREVSERFGVSRATANKVLSGLASEGLLEFRRGIGTFVRQVAIDYDLRSLVSFTQKAIAAGKQPATELCTFGCVRAEQALPLVMKSLQVPSQAELWELERLRLADGIPVIWEQRYIVRVLCPELTRQQAAASLYAAWTEAHQLQIAGADEVIRAVLLDETEAERLQVPAGAPALEVVAIGFLQDRKPLWWERTLYRGDQYEFHSRLGPIQSGTPARGKLRSS